MPRATQSREAGIINYFKQAELPIAVLVLGLCKEAVNERQTRSAEAKARAVKPAKPAAAPPAATVSAAAAPPKKAKKRRKRASRAKAAQPAAQIEGAGEVYSEDDLNG